MVFDHSTTQGQGIFAYALSVKNFWLIGLAHPYMVKHSAPQG